MLIINKLSSVYKSLNSLAPHYMTEMFHYVEDTDRPNLRSGLNKKLFIPRVHHNSIRYSAPKLWNDIELNIREAKSLTRFKVLLESKMSRR